MDTTALLQFISLYDNKKPGNAAKTHPKEYAALVAATNYLPATAIFRQRAYHIVTGLNDRPMCTHCKHTPVSWHHRYNRYLTFCSTACNNADGNLHEKRKKTLLKRYGVEHYSKSQLFNEQFKRTCMERYGTTHYNKSSEFINKIQQTKLTKYGRVNQNMVHISDASLAKLNDGCWLRQQHENEHRTLTNIRDELGDVSLQAIRTAFTKQYIPTQRFFTSMGERAIWEIVNDTGIESLVRYRKFPDIGELDIFIPSKNLAIEYNGLYWHSDERKNKYHLQTKQQLCSKRNIQLIHISEHEWLNAPQIVKHRLLTILGHVNIIDAEDCIIAPISAKNRDNFLYRTHLQGSCRASINLGLFHNSIIVGVAAFGRSRSNISGHYELLRYGTTLGIEIIGGMKKFMYHLTTSYQAVVIFTCCDNRWESGDEFLRLGFEKSHTLPLKSWYFKMSGKTMKMLSSTICQKHRLPQILGDAFNPDATEYDNMRTSGFKRIWDCGTTVYKLNISATTSTL